MPYRPRNGETSQVEPKSDPRGEPHPKLGADGLVENGLRFRNGMAENEAIQTLELGFTFCRAGRHFGALTNARFHIFNPTSKSLLQVRTVRIYFASQIPHSCHVRPREGSYQKATS